MARSLGEAPVVESDDREVWIKYFKVGSTKVRALTPVMGPEGARWMRYRYHYDPITQESYPCLLPYGTQEKCVGHSSSNEREVQAATGYLFWVLDENMRPQLYRVNVGLKESCEQVEEIAGPINGYDIIVTREGTGPKNSKYKVTKGETYELPWDEPLEDIKTIIGAQYDKALAARQHYFTGAGEEAPVSNGEHWQSDEAQADTGRITPAAAAPVEAPVEIEVPEPQEPATQVKDPAPVTPTPEEPAEPKVGLSDAEVAAMLPTITVVYDGTTYGYEEMDSPQMREWLAKHNAPTPPLNAGRGILVHAIRDRLAAGEPVF